MRQPVLTPGTTGARGVTAVMVTVMLSSAARVDAFGAAPRVMMRRGQWRSRLSQCAVVADPVRRAEEAPNAAGSDAGPRGFFEGMGSPRYIAAPMVEHSEAVRSNSSPFFCLLQGVASWLGLCININTSIVQGLRRGVMDYSVQLLCPEAATDTRSTLVRSRVLRFEVIPTGSSAH